MDNNRPHSRDKKVSGSSQGVHKRGNGIGGGPVGSSGGNHSSGGGNTGKRAAMGGGGALVILLIAMLIKGGGLSSLTGGSGGSDTHQGGSSTTTTQLDTSVASGSRAKRTVIKGNNKDSVTIMVYMCGTDLESKYGMASSDMEEMRVASSKFGDDFNLIVYTGGCNGWKNSSISSKVNQIYSIKNGKITRLVDDDGSKAMTDPSTLTSFIKYCTTNFPANRNELILWDHGGGSVSGFGYDEKNSSKGSMNLAGINTALKNSGTKFDFIGFDACLMATAENALMLNEYADYLIASEETEPGIGWYYTNWLKSFAADKSMPTINIGKNIIDDFVDECSRKCSGQKTTLSIIDLAEFANTVPKDLSEFARSVSAKIKDDQYKDVSDARYNTREFAPSSKIDQVDLVNLADNMNSSEGKALSTSIKGAVKYNRTSSNMTDAYGVSIYFPYKRTSYVDSACSTYSQIGMDSEYSKCIRQFASLETSGQVASGGSSSPIGSLFGLGGSGNSSSGGADLIGSLLGSFLGGTSDKTIDGLNSSNTDFMKDADTEENAEYIASYYFNSTNLIWDQNGDKYTMTLSDSQWDLVHGVDKNMFYYDGEGYIDLGLDNVFTLEGDTLTADADLDWVAVNDQPVAYYHTDSVKNSDGSYTDMGYVPAMLNGDRVNLLIVFNGGNGYISGASQDYVNGETDTVAKSLTELKDGDKIDFICDYYSNDLTYQDSYLFGDQMTYSSDMKVSNVPLDQSAVKIIYRFTDIYEQEYWSEAINK